MESKIRCQSESVTLCFVILPEVKLVGISLHN